MEKGRSGWARRPPAGQEAHRVENKQEIRPAVQPDPGGRYYQTLATYHHPPALTHQQVCIPRPALRCQDPFGPGGVSQDQRELTYLMRLWKDNDLRVTMIKSIPKLSNIIKDDEVFLAFPDSWKTEEERDQSDRSDSDESWGSVKIQSAVKKRMSLQEKFFTDIWHRLAYTFKLTTNALVIAIMLVHQYRSTTVSEESDVRSTGSPPTDFKQPSPPSRCTATEVLLVGLMVANKYTEDHPIANKNWAEILKIPLEHLNSIEQDFLNVIKHDIFVKEHDFNRWVLCLSGICELVPAGVRATNFEIWAQRPVQQTAPRPIKASHARRDSREDYYDRNGHGHHHGSLPDRPKNPEPSRSRHFMRI